MSSLSPSLAEIQICLSAADSSEYSNIDQLDRDVCSKIVQQLASKMTEVLTHPSVLNEIAQHGRNARSPVWPPVSLNNELNSSEMNERLLRFLTFKNPDLEAAIRYQKRSNEETNDENEDQEEFLSCTSTVVSQNNLSMFENFPKKLKRKRIAYTLIIAAVVLLVTILASGLTLFIVWVAMNSGSILVFDGIFNAFQFTNEEIQVSVGSSDDYNSAITNSNKSRLAISIELDRPGDWPTGTIIQMSTNVVSIRVYGTFHVKKLTSLLGKVSSLDKLELDNRDNLICTESTEPLRLFEKSNKVSISVKHLSLQYFKSSTCVEAFEWLYENVEFNSLEAISIKDSEIKIDNVALHESMLCKNRKSLKKLEITNATFDNGLFQSKSVFRFDNIRTLVVEESSRKKNTTSTSLVGNICSLFPNVEKLAFGMKLKHITEITDLIECTKLKSLQIRIWIPYANKGFSLSFLAKNFPNLESADLTLSFGISFPVSDEECMEHFMHVDGKNDLPKLLLANIRLASNCRLKFND